MTNPIPPDLADVLQDMLDDPKTVIASKHRAVIMNHLGFASLKPAPLKQVPA